MLFVNLFVTLVIRGGHTVDVWARVESGKAVKKNVRMVNWNRNGENILEERKEQHFVRLGNTAIYRLCKKKITKSFTRSVNG